MKQFRLIVISLILIIGFSSNSWAQCAEALAQVSRNLPVSVSISPTEVCKENFLIPWFNPDGRKSQVAIFRTTHDISLTQNPSFNQAFTRWLNGIAQFGTLQNRSFASYCLNGRSNWEPRGNPCVGGDGPQCVFCANPFEGSDASMRPLIGQTVGNTRTIEVFISLANNGNPPTPSPTPTISPTTTPTPTTTPDNCAEKKALWEEFEDCRNAGIRASREGRKQMPEEYSFPGRSADEASSALMKESTSNSLCTIKNCSRGMESAINSAQKIANEFRRGLINCSDSKGITEELETLGYLPFDYNMILNKQSFPWNFAGGFHKPLKKFTRFNLVSAWARSKDKFPLALSNFCSRGFFTNYGSERQNKGHVYFSWCECDPNTIQTRSLTDVRCLTAEASAGKYSMAVKVTNLDKLLKRFRREVSRRAPVRFTLAPRGINTDPRKDDQCFN